MLFRSLGGGLPYYVVGKNMDENVVYVSRNLEDELMWRKDIQLTSIHWIAEAPVDGEQIQVRLRHRGKLLPATIQGDHLILGDAERAVAAGQSAVIYRGDAVLGGGIVA